MSGWGGGKPKPRPETEPSFLPRPAWQELPPGGGLTLEMGQEPPTWDPLGAQRQSPGAAGPGCCPRLGRGATWLPAQLRGLGLAPLGGWGPVTAEELQCSQGGVAPSLHGGCGWTPHGLLTGAEAWPPTSAGGTGLFALEVGPVRVQLHQLCPALRTLPGRSTQAAPCSAPEAVRVTGQGGV